MNTLKNILKKKIFWISLLIIAVSLFYFFRDDTAVIPVSQAQLEQQLVRKTVSGSGVVSAKNEADLSFALSGTLTEVNVAKGESVEKGATLARLFSSDAYLSALARRDARDVALRDIDLYVENYSTNMDAVGGRDEYELSLRRLRELASSAESTYQASWSTLSKYIITAPFSGTVLDINAEVGETAIAGTTLIKLADLSNLVLEVELDQEDFGLVKVGQNAQITLDSYPDVVLNAKVSEIPLFVDSPDQQSFIVKLLITSQEDVNILLGMEGDVDILIADSGGEVPTLTFDQVFFDENDSAFVWINDNGILKKEDVEIGLEGDIYTEIKTELGNNIVVPISSDITPEEGMKVEISE